MPELDQYERGKIVNVTSSTGALQVYWCYTYHRHWVYLRNGLIDNMLIRRVNFIAMISGNPKSLVSIFNVDR